MTFKQLAKKIFKEFEVGDRVRVVATNVFGVAPGSLGVVARNPPYIDEILVKLELDHLWYETYFRASELELDV